MRTLALEERLDIELATLTSIQGSHSLIELCAKLPNTLDVRQQLPPNLLLIRIRQA